MSPDTARQIIEAWRNHHRPARTIGARAHAALAHVRSSHKKKASVAAGLEMDINDELTPNITLSAAKNHPPSL